jgi:hypothetical protein
MATEVENPPNPEQEIVLEQQEFQPIDKELKQTIRKSYLGMKTTICINLNKNDIAGFNTPQPYYVSIQ